jgi:hypothetical protein
MRNLLRFLLSLFVDQRDRCEDCGELEHEYWWDCLYARPPMMNPPKDWRDWQND